MKVYCPHCSQKYTITKAQLGIEIDCQACKKIMVFDENSTQKPEPNQPDKPQPKTSKPEEESFKRVKCPHCEDRIKITKSQIGVEFDCPSCGEVVKFGKKKAKPAEAKPAEAKPAEAKPAEAKPAEAKSTEKKADITAKKSSPDPEKEPKAKEPKAKEPKAKEPKAKEPKAEKPKAEEPSKKIERVSLGIKKPKEENKKSSTVSVAKSFLDEDEDEEKTKKAPVAKSFLDSDDDDKPQNSRKSILKTPAAKLADSNSAKVSKNIPKVAPANPGAKSIVTAANKKKNTIAKVTPKKADDKSASEKIVAKKKKEKPKQPDPDAVSKVKCPHCDQKYSIKREQFGVEIECQGCSKLITFGEKKTPFPNSKGISKVFCPHCDKKYAIKESQFDKEIPCTACDELITFKSPTGYVFTKAESTRLVAADSDETNSSSFGQKLTGRPISKQNVNSTVMIAAAALFFLVIGAGGYVAYLKFGPNNTVAQTPETITPDQDDQSPGLTPAQIRAKAAEEAEAKRLAEEKLIDKKVETEVANNKKKADPPKQIDKSFIVTADLSDTLPPAVDSSNSRKFTGLELKAGYQDKVKPFFKEHCFRCHGGFEEGSTKRRIEGDLSVDKIILSITDEYTLSHLQNIIDVMAVNDMPPEEEPQPDPQLVTEVIDILTGHIIFYEDRTGGGGGRPIRRLTRTEFINSIWDLFNIRLKTEGLPDDLIVGHFENDIEILNMTEEHIDAYLRKSREVVEIFIETRTEKPGSPSHKFFEPYLKGSKQDPDDAIAKDIIEKFTIYAKRGRPVDPRYIVQLNNVFKSARKSGLSFWDAIAEPMTYSLCSIDSLFHFENRSPQKKSKTISGLELANRLSYTLWRSAPDIELIKLGRSGQLLNTEIKEQQIDRMINDPKFERFIQDFTTQWLELPLQDEIAVSEKLFKSFNTATKTSMKQETIQFLSHMMKNDLPVTNLVDSEFMILNETMAKHYGIKGVKGDKFRPVMRKGTEQDRARGGIITHAGILMQGSTGASTSIVERGAFIARKLIDRPPADPPPNIPELPVSGDSFIKLTAAELVKEHTSHPQCASCHSRIDPLGIGLENYDAIGRFRTIETRLIDPNEENSRIVTIPISTKGKLYDGQPFEGAFELKQVLMSKRHDLARGYIKALLTYINGREANFSDEVLIDKFARQAAPGNYQIRSIILDIVKSDIMLTY